MPIEPPAVLFVGTKHYGVWDGDVAGHNLACLRSVDHEQFKYLARVHSARLPRKPTTHQAALALRTAYGVGLETLLAWLAALVQAPHCVYAWLDLYRAGELDRVVKFISGHADEVPHLLTERPTWRKLSEIVHAHLARAHEDRALSGEITQRFGDFWRAAAADYLDPATSAEYNASKHGLRIQPGGFAMAIGPEHAPGETTPPDKMHQLGGSQHGGTVLRLERIADRPNDRRVVLEARNWDPDVFVGRLRLISMSLNNIATALRIINGDKRHGLRFEWPTPLDEFSAAWRPKAGISSFTAKFGADEVPSTARAVVNRFYKLDEPPRAGEPVSGPAK